jgi:putative membrane protein
MKKNSTLHTILFAGLLAFAACNNANNSTSTSDSTTTRTTDTSASLKESANHAAGKVEGALDKNEDSDFVVKAAMTNMAELKVLQAGIDKGTDKELKMHAKMMMADHKKMGDKVKAYATKKGYVLPQNDDGKGDEAVGNIDKKTKGKDWDKEWADHMVSAHNDAIGMFERGEGAAKDPDLKTIISGALPTLRSHLDMMKKLQDKLGK